MKVFVWHRGLRGLEPQLWDADLLKGKISKLHGLAAKIDLPEADQALSLQELSLKYAPQAPGAIDPQYRTVGFEQ